MKQQRLLGITTYLLARRSATAAELATRFGVSARTIYRDLDALSLAGIPIFCSRGAGGGVSLMADYTLPRIPIQQQEKEALFLALSELAATRHPHAASALEKLRALWGQQADPDWVAVDFTEYGGSRQQSEDFASLRRGILGRRLVEFAYYSSKGEHTHRRIEPMKLWFRGHSWYLFGYCLRREDYRLFKVSRMGGIRVCEDVFVPRDTESFDVFIQREGVREDRPPVVLHLRFAPRAKYRVLDAFGPGQISENRDGSMEVVCCYPQDEWVYGMLLSFGDAVEVLSPAHIREVLAKRLCAAAKYYQDELDMTR